MAVQRRQVNRQTEPPDAMLSISAASRLLGISRTQVRRYCDDGYLVYGLYPGGRRMIARNSIKAFLDRAMGGKL